MSRAKHTIRDLTIGSRILYRSKENWRTAAVSRLDETSVTLTVCSPTGRTYRLRRAPDAEIFFEGALAILLTREFENEDWKENFGGYDKRW